jgi:hypothetical protein
MAPKRTTSSGREKAVSLNPQPGGGFIQKEGSDERESKHFESDLAVDILEELYPLLLDNCTDEDDEVDTQAVFESLAGLLGLFIADYREGYGEEKAKAAFQDLVDLALNLYEERVAKMEEDETE